MPASIIVLSCVAALVLLAAGLQKVLLKRSVTVPMRRPVVGDGLTRLIGFLELAGAGGLVAGIWLRPLAWAAAIGLIVLLLGATAYHLRAGDYRDRRHRASAAMPIVLLVMVGSIAVLMSVS